MRKFANKGMSNIVDMRVQKRNGEMEAVSFDCWRVLGILGRRP